MSISTTYQPNAPQVKTGVGSAISNREDLSAELTLLAPEETPLLSLCAKGSAKGTYKEWTVDTLAAPSFDGIGETQDVNAFDDQFAGRGRLGNYVQKFRETFLVSDLQEAANSVGPANIAQAEAKAMRQLKRSVEAAICSDNDKSVEDGASSKYKLRGLGNWLQSAGPSDVPAAYRTPADSILGAAPTDTTFNNIIASIYTVNGEANNLTLIAGVALRKVISNFQRSSGQATSPAEAIYTINQDASSKKITHAVTLYDSDFGIVNVINANPACMPNQNRGYVVNPKYLGFDTYIPMGSTRLENQGAGERGYVDMVGTLVCKHPGAHGKIAHA
jgi:hypothetical protein